MKRNTFIQKISFLGVGFSLAPRKLLSADLTGKTFALPKPVIHIPHGNFATMELEKLIIPEYGLECSVQHFMRNGIESSAHDLTVSSFRRGDQFLFISCTSDGKMHTEGEITGLSIEVTSPDCQFFTLSEK
ncbi:MAG: hypothetical protein K9J17_05860 [Flavobacteriales bacterium]|nr:hypothetical protein [Flavobacteriales bacterium]